MQQETSPSLLVLTLYIIGVSYVFNLMVESIDEQIKFIFDPEKTVKQQLEEQELDEMIFIAFKFKSYFVIFFFQAEDGIRAHCVTGVQTCALPILDVSSGHGSAGTMLGAENRQAGRGTKVKSVGVSSGSGIRGEPRSEERSVGKECRSRWSPYH